MVEFDKIYNEDALSLLKRMDDNSIDCVVTSPPYYALRKYTDNDLEIGREQTPSEYIDNLVGVFQEVYRVLKPTGTVWVNIGDSYVSRSPNNRNFINNGGRLSNNPSITKNTYEGLKNKDLVGIPWMLAFALRDRIGFYLRQDIIWAKGNPMPESVTDRCGRESMKSIKFPLVSSLEERNTATMRITTFRHIQGKSGSLKLKNTHKVVVNVTIPVEDMEQKELSATNATYGL